MKRLISGIGILLAIQLVLVGVYWYSSTPSTEAAFPYERLDIPAPKATLFNRAQEIVPIRGRAVVHFWATWCGPCIDELPTLLAASSEEGIPLYAVSDEPWPNIERFFDGQVPESIVQDPKGDTQKAYQVSGLPDTFLVEDGRVVARIGGPRDWSLTGARTFLRGGEK